MQEMVEVLVGGGSGVMRGSWCAKSLFGRDHSITSKSRWSE
jgi:hypothetical protein